MEAKTEQLIETQSKKAIAALKKFTAKNQDLIEKQILLLNLTMRTMQKASLKPIPLELVHG
jgi:uncharacterized membrane protein (DUF106 family)